MDIPVKNLLLNFLALLSLLTLSIQAQAGQVADVKSSLMVARQNLVAMIEATDKVVMDKHKAEIAKATQALDGALASALTDYTQFAHKAGLQDFKATWEAFKATRDGDIIPALYAGDKDKAKGLAKGVQAERFKKMTGLLESMQQAGAK